MSFFSVILHDAKTWRLGSGGAEVLSYAMLRAKVGFGWVQKVMVTKQATCALDIEATE